MTILSAGLLFSDRIEALLDARISIPERVLSIHVHQAQDLFRSVLRDAKFDIAELSLCSHIAAVSAGRDIYAGVPVFPSRAFRHGNLYIRTDRIEKPADLAGKRIGLIDFQQTAALWLRGILAADYGVPRESIEWVTGGLHAPVLTDRMPANPPRGMTIRRTSKTLDALLRNGEIDAIISPMAPLCHRDAAVPVGRMWPDFAEVQFDWWQRTQIFPIMHVLVVRRSIIEIDPGLPAAVCDAFDQALHLAKVDVAERDFSKVVMADHYSAAQKAEAKYGVDLWSTGIISNQAVLERAIDNAQADGITTRSITIEDLFPSFNDGSTKVP